MDNLLIPEEVKTGSGDATIVNASLGIVRWTCPHCQAQNEDDYVATSLLGCGECWKDVDWGDILSYLQFDWLNATKFVYDEFEPNQTLRAVINQRHGTRYLATGEARGKFRRFVRTVTVLDRVAGPRTPPEFADHKMPEWAKDRPWILWSGAAHIDGAIRTISGWSWNGGLPLLWGYDAVNGHSADLSIWPWIAREDYINRPARPWMTFAEQYLSRYGMGYPYGKN